MTRSFVDSGYLIALEDEDDQNHVIALAHWKSEMSSSRPFWITTSYVLDEVATYFNACNLHTKAVETGRVSKNTINSQEGLLLHPHAWGFFISSLQRHRGQGAIRRVAISNSARTFPKKELAFAVFFLFFRKARRSRLQLQGGAWPPST